jgi:putative membrane protein
VTVEAVTAAGAGGYPVLDVSAADGVALADATTPGLLTRFLPTSPETTPVSSVSGAGAYRTGPG